MSVLRLLKTLIADSNARIGELLTDRNTLIEYVWSNARLLEESFPELAKAQREAITQMLDRDEKAIRLLEQEAAQGIPASGELH